MKGDSKLGILAFLGATALVLVALVAFARYPSLLRGGKEYHAVFRSVSGLNLGDEVRYGGLLVGSITAMQLDSEDPTRIDISFRVKKNTPVRVDTRASITQVGLLGAPHLNLVTGQSDAAELPPGNTLETEDNLTFQDAMSKLARFLGRADTLFSGAEKIAATSPLERLDRTLVHADSLFMNANRGSQHLFSRLDSANNQLTSVLARTERLVAALDTTVRSARPEIASTQKAMVETLNETRQLVAELRNAMDRGERVEAILRDLSKASDDLARLTNRIEREPLSVLRRQAAPKKR
ncbi:MAG: MCE family protein, partial [Anaerolineae bacterium]|nr:MCE family protein [Gemmatimonadaceae bacterium]